MKAEGQFVNVEEGRNVRIIRENRGIRSETSTRSRRAGETPLGSALREHWENW